MYIKQIAYADFYDGGQLFHWKTCESWCFLTSIVNLAFYRHFDLRVQVVYGRITKEQHLAAAREARVKNAKRKTVEEFKVKGFKDVWPFDRLPYSDLARNSSIPLQERRQLVLLE